MIEIAEVFRRFADDYQSYQRRVKASNGRVLDESWPPMKLGGGLDPVRIVGEIAAPLCQDLIEIGQGVEMLIGQRLIDYGPEMLGWSSGE